MYLITINKSLTMAIYFTDGQKFKYSEGYILYKGDDATYLGKVYKNLPFEYVIKLDDNDRYGYVTVEIENGGEPEKIPFRNMRLLSDSRQKPAKKYVMSIRDQDDHRWQRNRDRGLRRKKLTKKRAVCIQRNRLAKYDTNINRIGVAEGAEFNNWSLNDDWESLPILYAEYQDFQHWQQIHNNYWEEDYCYSSGYGSDY